MDEAKQVNDYVQEFHLDRYESKYMKELICSITHLEKESIDAAHQKVSIENGIETLLDYLQKHHKKDLVPGEKESLTMEIYIATLRTNGLPWLVKK